MDDYPICYFDNLEEVLKCINYNSYDLVKQFKNKGNLIRVVLNNKFYRLARFVD